MEQSSNYFIIDAAFVLCCCFCMKNRIKRKELAYYHCMSRIVGRQMLLGDVEKEHMRGLIRRVEGFTGVHVLTYAVMTNHVHVLLEEPDRATVIDDAEFWRRMAFLYSEVELAELDLLWRGWTADGCGDLVAAGKARYLNRMHDISEFMKQVKQRFSHWYNRRNGRFGTLWDARFRSVLVEGGDVLRIVASYIEMNPVRAGMSSDPSMYRFCGFAEAVHGGVAAQKGVMRLVRLGRDAFGVTDAVCQERAWAEDAKEYFDRVLMYGGVKSESEDMRYDERDGRPLPDDFVRLLRRCRYFTDGRVIGGRAFVEAFFEENRDYFGPKRMSGGRKIRGGWPAIYAVRDLGKGC
ncbi:MAG: transposase [Spartobacteria bacterium]|nr:transposase [Spartobacteria bacterium]